MQHPRSSFSALCCRLYERDWLQHGRSSARSATTQQLTLLVLPSNLALSNSPAVGLSYCTSRLYILSICSPCLFSFSNFRSSIHACPPARSFIHSSARSNISR
eukprot:6211349-Pleurochrysis_carterae.AAC.3